MRIIHCLNNYLPDHIAGTEMYVYALSKAQQAMGNRVTVVIPNYEQSITEEYIYDNTCVIKYAEPSVPDRDLQMGRTKPAGLTTFTAVLKNARPDVVHFHEMAGSNGISLHHVKAARSAGYKVVMTFHLATNSCKTGTLMYRKSEPCDGIINIKKCTLCSYHARGLSTNKTAFLFPLALALHKIRIDASGANFRLGTAIGFPFLIEKLQQDLQLLANSCSKLVVLSKWYYDVLVRNGIAPGKLCLVQQAVYNNLQNTTKANAALQLPLKVIFIGRISHFKGVKLLITAIKNIGARDITLDIYGDTGEQEYMESCKVMSAGMDNVTWKGRVEQPDVITRMQAYDILCLPSTFSEMSPLVIQEAFAAGIPVLASAAPGNAAQVSHGVNGWLFKFNDAGDLTLKLRNIIDDLSLVSKAKENLPGVIGFDVVAQQYDEIYSSIWQDVPAIP